MHTFITNSLEMGSLKQLCGIWSRSLVFGFISFSYTQGQVKLYWSFDQTFILGTKGLHYIDGQISMVWESVSNVIPSELCNLLIATLTCHSVILNLSHYIIWRSCQLRIFEFKRILIKELMTTNSWILFFLFSTSCNLCFIGHNLICILLTILWLVFCWLSHKSCV